MRVFESYGLVDGSYDCLSVQTIPLSVCMDIFSRCVLGR